MSPNRRNMSKPSPEAVEKVRKHGIAQDKKLSAQGAVELVEGTKKLNEAQRARKRAKKLMTQGPPQKNFRNYPKGQPYGQRNPGK